MTSEAIATIVAAIIGLVGVLIPFIWRIIQDKKRKKDENPIDASEVADPEVKKDVKSTNYDLFGEGFYGRNNEVRRVQNFFREDKKRLVTLTGFGGFGKTRLAKEIGHSLFSRYPGGVWFVSFVESTTIDGMAKEVYDAFGLDSSSAQFDSGIEAVVDLLKTREKSFLILDNFEHILDFADETVSVWLRELPNIDFLVTSRFALNISLEQQYKIGALELLPKSEDNAQKLKNNAAVKLFVERAKQVNYEFALNTKNASVINHICHEVEGIPLAIEIAAGYINISEEEILSSLKKNSNLKNKKQDTEGRHVTLEKVIEWSYKLLKPIEKEVFLQLSIFKDGFDLDGAKSIVSLKNFPNDRTVVEVLGNLQDKSLLFINKMSSNKRFSMLVSVERFAEEKLKDSKSQSYVQELTERWSNYFLKMLRSHKEESTKKTNDTDNDRISDNIENIFSVQDTCLNEEDFDKAAETILLVSNHLSIKGPALLRVPRLKKSFDSINDGHTFKGDLSLELAKAHADKGELNEAELYAQKAYSIFKNREELKKLPGALLQIGSILKSRGFFKLSQQFREDALEAALQNDVEGKNANYYMWLANSFERMGHFKEADENFGLAVDMAKENGEKVQLSIIYSNWALSKWHEGKPIKALQFNHKAQELGGESENFKWKPAFLTNEALILCELERYSEAVDTSVEADLLHKKQGTLHWAAVNFGSWGRALLRRNQDDDFNESKRLLLRSLKVSRELYWPDNIAMVLEDLAKIEYERKNFQRSYDHLLEAIALERRMGLLKEYRHFSKLVLMAVICRELGRADIRWECLTQALELNEVLKIDGNYEVKHVIEELKILEEEIQKWSDEHGLKGKILLPPEQIGNLKLEPDFSFKLLHQIKLRFKSSSYGFPWFNLEDIFDKKKKDSIKLFGYGSLLNKFSAKETFNPESVNEYVPAIAFGIRRLLDYNMPDEVRARPLYEGLTENKELGLFNTRYTGSITDNANGAIIEVPIEEFKNLRSREIGYDLRPVVCLKWPINQHNPDFIFAYALGCSGRTWEGKALTDSSLLPHRAYLKLCREGAEGLGEEFLNHFLETSFLGDGVTTVKEWERL